MITFANGWAQWDYQIGTFRAQVDGVIYGTVARQYLTVEALSAACGVAFDPEQVSDLMAEKAANPVPSPRILTPLQFRRLFTLNERVAVDNFATNPDLSDQQKAVLTTLTKDFDAAQEIDLDDPDTQAGIQTLEAYGLLAEGRAAEILG